MLKFVVNVQVVLGYAQPQVSSLISLRGANDSRAKSKLLNPPIASGFNNLKVKPESKVLEFSSH